MTSIIAPTRSWLLWLSPFAVLVLLLGWETDWGRSLERAPPSETAVAPQPVSLAVLPAFQPQATPETNRDMVERTLFNPTRRPAPVAVAETAKPRIQRGQFALTGTIMVEGKSYALLRESNGGKARRVAKGDTINGMLVTEVKPDRIVLSQGDESEELALKLAVGPRVTIQPAVVASMPGRGVPAAPGAVAAAPQPAQVRDVSEVLAERRRAARAAEAAAAGRPPGSPIVAPVPGAAPAIPAGAAMQPAAPAAAAQAPDPQWQSVYQRYQQPRR